MGFYSTFCCLNGSDNNNNKKKKKGKETWRAFSLKELRSATNNFSDSKKIGEGGFGSVYWGQLWDGSQVAVKRLKSLSNKADMEFACEVEILARARHNNLLNLLGYCAQHEERLIVYDYMPNLSLFSHLHGIRSHQSFLHWNRRINIAIGSAQGIAYLHHELVPHTIHRDIKASNVLLDSEFKPQVADFGFARLIPDGATHVTTRVKGTLGYLAPEYAMLGKATESCDVYSFGILLLELATGEKPLKKLGPSMKRTIRDWALPLARERKFDELADPKLNGVYVEEELRRMVIVALVCTDERPDKRPSMVEVVEVLKGESDEKMGDFEEKLLLMGTPSGGDYYSDGSGGAENSPDFMAEEEGEEVVFC